MNKAHWQALRHAHRFEGPRWPTWGLIAFDAAVLAGAAYLALLPGAVSWLAVPLLTLVMLHAYLLTHEATHGAISHRRRVNDLVGHLCGWLILLPFLVRQSSHVLHHAWTAHPVGDPANRRLIESFAVMTDKQAARLELIWKCWLPLLAINDRVGLWRAPFLQRRAGSATARTRREIRAARRYGLGYLAALLVLAQAGVLIPVLMVYLPAFLLLTMLEELVNLPHHAQTHLLAEEDAPLPLWEQESVTHSCRSVPLWSRFVLLNFNLHTAHHLFPAVPWYGLRRIQTALEEDVARGDDEWSWSLGHRRQPLLEVMGHYFDRIGKR